MNLRERKDYNRLRRRSAFLAIVVFFLLICIKNLFDDKSWYLYENHQLIQSNLDKDSQLRKMKVKIDSLQKSSKAPIPQVVSIKQHKKKFIPKDTTINLDTSKLIKYLPEIDLPEIKDTLDE